jgi:hypothetical protein
MTYVLTDNLVLEIKSGFGSELPGALDRLKPEESQFCQCCAGDLYHSSQ